jgi:hypothetical protein
VRYWIYWNDLVQGPFEVGELSALKAFTADLPVCEEEGQEWIPAAAVTELLPFFQPVESLAAPSSLPPPPPPPPPSQPPSLVPLQGEFFKEASSQQALFDLNGSKNYSYTPVEDAAPAPEVTPEPFHTPFRFIAVNVPPLIEIPELPPPVWPKPERPPIPIPEPEIPYSPEPELGILEPEDNTVAEPEAPAVSPEPVIEKIIKPLPLETPPPEPVKPASLAPAPTPPPAVVPEPVSPKVMKPVPLARSEIIRRQRQERLAAAPPPVTPSFDLPPAPQEHVRLWPWMAGVMCVLVAGASVFYLRMNRSPIAIEESAPVKMEEPVPSAPEPEPSAPAAVPVEPPPLPPPEAVKPVKKAVVKPAPKLKPKPKPSPKPKPVPVAAQPEPSAAEILPVLETPPEPIVEPPAAAPAPVPAPAAAPALVPEPVLPPSPAAAPPEPNVSAPAPEPVSPWKGREQDAIAQVLKTKIYGGKRTIGENAKMILNQTHEKELLHAAETGQRLYLPDKISWSELQEEGARFRVYLTFVAWQANGERVQARSDAFLVDLEKKTVAPADDNTRHDFYDPAAMPQHQQNPKAGDIDSILSAIDTLNRQKVSAVVLKSSRRGKDEQKAQQAAMQTAENKLQRTVVYFRTKYAEKTLQNVAKAYAFEAALKGK